MQGRAQNVAENQGQNAENAAETNSISNAAENNESMQVSDGTAAADDTTAAASAADAAEASGASDNERREMVISNAKNISILLYRKFKIGSCPFFHCNDYYFACSSTTKNSMLFFLKCSGFANFIV